MGKLAESLIEGINQYEKEIGRKPAHIKLSRSELDQLKYENEGFLRHSNDDTEKLHEFEFMGIEVVISNL